MWYRRQGFEIALYLLIVVLFLSFCNFTYQSSRIKIFLFELILPWLFVVCLYHNFKSGFPELIFSTHFFAFLLFFLLALPLYFYNPFRYVCFEKLLLNFLFLMFLYVIINIKNHHIITVEKLLFIISIPIFIYGGVQFLGWDIIHPYNEYLSQRRIYSFFFNPNDLALFSNLIFFLALSYYRKHKNLVYLILSLGALLCLIGTKSGSGGLIFILGSFLFLHYIFPRFRAYWVYLSVIFSLGVFILVIAGRNNSLFYRLFLWGDSFRAIKLHPLRGWGVGSFQYIYPYFRKPEIFVILKTHQIEFLHPENYFIHLLFEGGIIYLFSFLIANVLLVRELFSNKETQIYGILIAIFLFQNLFSETFASFLPYLCYILVVGISLVSIGSQKKDVIVNIRITRALIFCSTIINLAVSFLAIRILVADIYLQRAIYNSQNINFLQAEKFYKKSIAWSYFNPLAHYLLGNLYLEKGSEEDLYQALSYYTNVENMAGNYLQVYFFKWIIFNRLGDKAFAGQYFQKAFRTDPYVFYRMNQFEFDSPSM